MAKKLQFDQRVVNLDLVKVYKRDGSRILLDEQIHINYSSSKEAQAMFEAIIRYDCNQMSNYQNGLRVLDMNWQLAMYQYQQAAGINRHRLDRDLEYGFIDETDILSGDISAYEAKSHDAA